MQHTPKVIFTEHNHLYSFPATPEITSVSGTKFVGHFQKPFNKNYWLTIKAAEVVVPIYPTLKREWENAGLDPESEDFIDLLISYADPEELEEQIQSIAEMWDKKGKDSSEMGTELHLEKELASYERGWELNPFDNKKYPVHPKVKLDYCDNYSLADNLSELPDGFYPELLVFHERLVGQADKVWIGSDKFGKYVDIIDLKFFEKLTTRGYYNKFRKTYAMFLPPIDNIEDSKLHKTGLQTSTYFYCLEQHGLQPRYSALEHYGKLHSLPYYREEVKKMYAQFPWEEF